MFMCQLLGFLDILKYTFLHLRFFSEYPEVCMCKPVYLVALPLIKYEKLTKPPPHATF